MRVNGQTAVLGQRVDPDERPDRARRGGPARPARARPLRAQQTGRRRDHGRRPPGPPHGGGPGADDPRVFPVGRLDADSEGLLILTNDGELAQRLTHPSFGVEKEYLAEVEGVPAAGALRRLRQGVELDDGMTAPATVGVVGPGVLRIVIHEGRNRQIRRMAEAVGHPVRRLVRTRIGPLTERGSGPGEWRPLSLTEVRDLAAAAGPGRPRPAERASDRPGQRGRATRGRGGGR